MAGRWRAHAARRYPRGMTSTASRGVTTVGLVVALAALGCGGGGSGEDPDAAPAPDAGAPDATPGLALDDVDDAYVDAYCGYAVRCGQISDLALCERLFTGELLSDFVQFEANVEDGTVVFDPEAAAACIAAIEDWSCDTTAENNRSEPEACGQVFTGTVAEGGDCYIDEQCADGGNCAPIKCIDACCLSECVAGPPEVDLGDSCVDAICPADAFCNDANECEALLPENAPCSYDGMCDYGLACPDGTCVPLPATGEACPDGACQHAGDSCVEGICARRGSVGDDCSVAQCQFGLLCTEGAEPTCASFPTIGQSCAAAGFCSEGYCDVDSTVCEELLGAGAACSSGLDCEVGLLCDDTQEPAECTAPVACE